MEEGFRDRAAFIRGAKDIAKEVKKHAAKKVVKGLDRVQDEYSRRSYSRFEEEEDDDDYPAPADGYYRGDGTQDEEEGGASSDATEGHDEDDEIYEGEYQGIPRAESGGKGERMADGAPLAGVRGGLGDGEGPPGGRGEAQRRKEREELAQQYEAILRECGHGRFQWTLYFVLGLALMADGVEVFVVGFVLPSAEKDMCLSDSNKGMLGKTPWRHSGPVLPQTPETPLLLRTPVLTAGHPRVLLSRGLQMAHSSSHTLPLGLRHSEVVQGGFWRGADSCAGAWAAGSVVGGTHLMLLQSLSSCHPPPFP